MRRMLVIVLAALAPAPLAAQDTVYEPGVDVGIYYVGEELGRVPVLVEGQTPNVHELRHEIDWDDDDFGGLEDYFLTIVRGRLHVPARGNYVLRLTSDDGSYLLLDGEKVLDHDGLHGPTSFDTGVMLEKKTYELEVHHFENAGGARLKLEWKPPGASEFTLIAGELLSTPKGVVRPPSPGKKRILHDAVGRAPGDGRPLRHLHPSYDLFTVRPEGFEPKVGGLDFLPDGRMIICCWEPDGGVYVLDGVHGDDREKITVERIAAGLAEPLGLKVVGDRIFVLQKQELTELIDLDGDDVIDEYRCLCDAWTVSPNFHEFAFGLIEKDGWLYFNLAIAINPGGSSTKPQVEDRGRTLRVEIETGRHEFLTWGLRTPNGIGLGPDGEIYLTDNQGDWLPSSKVLRLKRGAFYNQRAALPAGWKERPVTPPVVWMPQNEVGNSPGEPGLIPSGVFAGQLAVCEVTHGGIKRVFIEEVDGVQQGALFRMTQGLEAGINRMKIREDGTIFVGGIGSGGNWGQAGKLKYGLQRLTPNGEPSFEMRRVRAYANGFLIELTEPLAPGMGWDRESYHVRRFHYVPTASYGGPKQGLTKIVPERVHVLVGRKMIFLEMEMKAGEVYYLRIPSGFRSELHRAPWSTEAWYTLNRVPSTPYQGPFGRAPAARANELGDAERREGWQLLFDGQRPVGFRGFKSAEFPEKGWVVEDGCLKKLAGVSGGDIVTREQFEDFELQCEWNVAPGGNSGIIYLASEDGPATWSSGPEMQILDDGRHADGGNPLTSAGALYALVPCRRPAVRPAGEWNHARIRVKDRHVTHWLNGVEVVSCDLDGPAFRRLVAASKFKSMPSFGRVKRGHIALQDHGDEVRFRNVMVRRLGGR